MNEMTQYVKEINSPQIHPYNQYHYSKSQDNIIYKLQ